MENERICGNCRWHRFESEETGWICSNPDSDCLADYTEYEDRCFDFEEKG